MGGTVAEAGEPTVTTELKGPGRVTEGPEEEGLWRTPWPEQEREEGEEGDSTPGEEGEEVTRPRVAGRGGKGGPSGSLSLLLLVLVLALTLWLPPTLKLRFKGGVLLTISGRELDRWKVAGGGDSSVNQRLKFYV